VIVVDRRLHRTVVALLLPCLAALALAGCGGEKQDAAGTSASPSPTPSPSASVTFPLTITDGAGIEHTFDQPVTKIGCIYYGCIEDLADMGLVPHAAPEGDAGITFLYPQGGPAVEIGDVYSPEEWAKAGVDVIVDLSSPTAEDDAKALKAAAPVFFLNAPYKVWNPDNYTAGAAAWRDDLTALGQITGQPEKAQQALGRFDAFVAALKAKAPAEAATTDSANLMYTDDGTYSLMDPASPFCEVLGANGLGSCVQIPGWSVDSWEVNSEAFLAADPPWIAYTVYAPDQTYKDRDDPVWKRLTAVKDGQVFDFTRTNCCSLRVLEHALQDYAFNVWGPASGVPDPGPEDDFDPTTSPLAQGA
jgi:iron complex transport system substrate-binding protein